MSTNPAWEAEKNYYSEIASGIIGRPVTVEDAETGLGYTAKGSTIHVARKHPYYDRMSTQEATAFRYGVVVHESLHQVFTNFGYYRKTLNRLQKNRQLKNGLESRLYQDLVNLVEDPAIENMAGSVIGGPALHSLSFMIWKIDQLADDLGSGCRFPFEELYNALIQFGDLGILHGEFRFPAAGAVFKKISPMFYDAINEPNNTKRIDMVYPILAECRPLWDGFTEMMQSEMLKKMDERDRNRIRSVNEESGNGKGENGTVRKDTGKNRKREECLKRLGTGRGNGDGKNEEEVEKETETAREDERNTGNDRESGRESRPDHAEEKNRDVRPEEPGKTTGTGTATEKPRNGDTAKAGDESPENGSEQDTTDAPDCTKADPPEFTEADLRTLLDMIGDRHEEDERAQADRARYRTGFHTFRGSDSFRGFREHEAVNRYASEEARDDGERYEAVLQKMSGGISMLQDQLREIFIQDRVYKVHSESGRANLKRFASGKVTTRLFDRRRRPDRRMNMCVGVLGDSSGSMEGTKIANEILAIIALAETFAEFDIPFYFIGFNCLEAPIQTHYIRWNNTRYERERVLHMDANGRNFDSYSIRYMTELLQERSEKHKILFVLSDGLPSAFYPTETGIRLNAEAIADAREAGIDVVGFGIGDVDEKSFLSMYGKPFYLNIRDAGDIFEKLADRLTAVVAGWNKRD